MKKTSLLTSHLTTRTTDLSDLFLLETLFSKAPVGFALINKDMEFIRVNEYLADIKDLSPEDYIGKNIMELFPRISPILIPLIQKVIQTNQPILETEINSEITLDNPVAKHWLDSFYPVIDQAGEVMGVGMIVTDITERKAAEELTRYQAYHDILTGLPNRLLLEEHLNHTISVATRNKENLAIIFLDLNRFKNINDTLGHATGDKLLVEVAGRLLESVRSGDIVARLGGDEFIIMLSKLARKEDVERVASKIFHSFRMPFNIDGQDLFVSASMGIALYPYDGQTSATLLKNADIDLYRSKAVGGNSFELYTNSMNRGTSHFLNLENSLARAIEQGEFTLHYQPIFDLESGDMLSTEALLRWQHPKLGMIYPDEFISIAEQTGLITALGKFTLKEACLQTKIWQKKFNPNLKVNVNVSARQFQEENIVSVVEEVLESTGFEGKFLNLEITESLAAHNPDLVVSRLRALKELGVGVSIDDFGTGYSSLSSLQKFPVDTLKIDRTFVRGCITNSQDRAIVQAVVSMAHGLGINVVAEGVETKKQLDFLAGIKCDQAQGFLFNIPMSPEKLSLLMGTDHNIYSTVPTQI